MEQEQEERHLTLSNEGFVSWNSSGGRAEADRSIERDGTIDVPDSSFPITGTEDDPAALITLYRDKRLLIGRWATVQHGQDCPNSG